MSSDQLELDKAVLMYSGIVNKGKRMTIEWPEWRIKSYDHGYQVQKITGGTRWVAQSYHGTLAQAVDSLLQYRIRVETENHTILAIDKASAASSTAKLVTKIESITAEVLAGVNEWS